MRKIRPYDLRHTFASLLITAGKSPLYLARQMGHYSAGFTLDTYGHLMDALPKRQVEWIDEMVFPEGWKAALKRHSENAPEGAWACSPVQSPEATEPLENMDEGNLVQAGTTVETREEVERNIYEAIQMHVRGLREDNLPIPKAESIAEYIAVH
ncbi:MAG TPA: hypothetical protein VJT32_04035 [bacterium]|nr:hypothetical protein [bacterium]